MMPKSSGLQTRTKFDIRMFSHFYSTYFLSWTFWTFLNFIINSSQLWRWSLVLSSNHRLTYGWPCKSRLLHYTVSASGSRYLPMEWLGKPLDISSGLAESSNWFWREASLASALQVMPVVMILEWAVVVDSRR